VRGFLECEGIEKRGDKKTSAENTEVVMVAGL